MKQSQSKRTIYTHKQREFMSAARYLSYLHFWVNPMNPDHELFEQLYKLGKFIKRWDIKENKEKWILVKKGLTL